MNQADIHQQARENLSAAIDGELSREQMRFLWRRLEHDAPLQEAWARYHLARDGLHRQLPALATSDFSSRVMRSIDGEASSGAARRPHWLRWSAGGAIAASVAAVALMVARPAGNADGGVSPVAALPSTSTTELARVAAPGAQQLAPVAAPFWLSGNSAGLLSQQASATMGSSFDVTRQGAANRGTGDSMPNRYRMLDNNDGSYLLLLDPQQRVGPNGAARPRAAVAQ